MLADVIWVVVGLAALIFGAEKLVTSAERLARYWGMSQVLIGAVVVGLGTSLPEMLISGLAAGRPQGLDLAMGNIVGSNIANLSLVLGVAILIAPLQHGQMDLRREWTAMLVGSAMLVALAWNNALSRLEGILLVAALAAALALLVRWSRRPRTLDAQPGPVTSGMPPTPRTDALDEWMDRAKGQSPARWLGIRIRPSLGKELLTAAVSLVLTLWGADRLVEGATGIADRLNVSGGLVGLTLVALGTSLPELATGVIAARHGNIGLVIGNVLGSNLFNALAVGGIAGLVGDGVFGGDFRVSLLWMLAIPVVAGGLANGLRHADRQRLLNTANPLLKLVGPVLVWSDTAVRRLSQTRIVGGVLVAFYPLALLMAGL